MNYVKTVKLKTLEEEGLIQRIEYSQIPPKVEYSLTNIGKKFEKVLDALGEQGEEYIDYLNQKNCQTNSYQVGLGMLGFSI